MDFSRLTSSSRGVSDRDALLELELLPPLADSPDETRLITSLSRTTLRAYASTAAWGSLPAVSSFTASCARLRAATRARREDGRDPDGRGGERGVLEDGEGRPLTVEPPDELDPGVDVGSGGRLRLGGFIGRLEETDALL